LEPHAPQHVELKPFARHDRRFEAARRASEAHGRAGTARQQLARDRDPRIQVPAGTAAGDHDAAGGGHASAVTGAPGSGSSTVVMTWDADACCDTFSRMPVPIMLTSRDDPPKLTNGSGMPLVGSSPSVTLMLKKACTVIIAVMPSARNAPNRSGARIAVLSPRHAITQKHASRTVVPASPSSSPMTE